MKKGTVFEDISTAHLSKLLMKAGFKKVFRTEFTFELFKSVSFWNINEKKKTDSTTFHLSPLIFSLMPNDLLCIANSKVVYKLDCIWKLLIF